MCVVRVDVEGVMIEDEGEEEGEVVLNFNNQLMHQMKSVLVKSPPQINQWVRVVVEAVVVVVVRALQYLQGLLAAVHILLVQILIRV